MLLKGSEQGSEMEEEGILLALKGIPLGSIFFFCCIWVTKLAISLPRDSELDSG